MKKEQVIIIYKSLRLQFYILFIFDNVAWRILRQFDLALLQVENKNVAMNTNSAIMGE